MKAIVFLGPTLSAEAARRELDATYRPPVAQGDVLRAAGRNPDVIAIVDGQFDHVPAVWHKEILWAMSRGIHVYGSASMGALRAAELHAFGMVGIGRIFEWYRDGFLEDDDEVAVAHGPVETGYRATSESMANIRCTLQAAECGAIISARTHALLLGIAKQRYFPERGYEVLLEAAAGTAPPAELARLSDWLGDHRVDQKRVDAIEMLREIRARTSDLLVPKRVAFTFEPTIFWRHLAGTASVADDASGDADLTDGVIEELWLDPDACVRVHADALLRHVVLEHAQADRHVHGEELAGTSTYRHRLLDQLRLSGTFSELAERARRKRAVLSAHQPTPSAETTEEAEAGALLDWYLAHGDAPGPGHATFLELARANWREFVGALVRERDYRRLTGP